MIGLASIGQSQPWDFTADFPTVTGGPNPNGVWAYGYLLGGLSEAPYYPAAANDYHPAGLNTLFGNDELGSFTQNPFPTDMPQPTWPDGMFFKANGCNLMTGSTMHGCKTAAGFIAPQKGNYTINALFQSGVMNDWDTKVGVVVEDVWIYTDTVTSFLDRSSFDAVVALEAGQKIYFALDNIPGQGGWDGGYHTIIFDAVVDVDAYDPEVFPPFDPDDYPIDGVLNPPADPNDHTPRFFIPLVPAAVEPNEPPAASWDYTASYPSTFGASGNPNGAWTYGYYQNKPGGLPFVLAPLNDYHPGGLNILWGNDNSGGFGFNPMADDLAMPGWPDGMYFKGQRAYLETPASTLSNKTTALFTAPYAGIYQVDAYFESGVMNGYATDVAVLINDNVINYNRVSGFDSGPENIAEFSRVLDLAEGDTLGFSLNHVPGQGGWNGGFHIVDFNATLAITDPGNLPEPLPSEMLLWLKADTGVVDPNSGQPVAIGGIARGWQDQSGNGLNAILAYGDPTLATGSFHNGDQPVIRFDGDDSLLLYDTASPNYNPGIGDPLSTSSFSIYVVGKLSNNQVNSSFIASVGEVTGWDVGISATQQNKMALTTVNSELAQANALLLDKYYLIACTVSDNFERKLYLNGVLVANDNGSVNYRDPAVLIGNLFQGDIAEIQVFQGVDETQHAATQTALMDKYALDYSCADQAEYFDTDLNQDCYVNLEDVTLLAGGWLNCNDPLNPDECDPIAVFPTPFEALSWDYNAEYPAAAGGSNPNGVWTYGYYKNGVGKYKFALAPANDYHPDGLNIFWGTDALGGIGKNPSLQDKSHPEWGAPNGMFFKANRTYLETPASTPSNHSTARFTAPFEATYQLHAEFESGVTAGFATDVAVVVNSVVVFTETISGFRDDPTANTATLDALVALPEGGTVDFAAIRIPNGTAYDGGFHIVDFNAELASIEYNPDDFPAPFNPDEYPLEPNDIEPNVPVLIAMSPLYEEVEPDLNTVFLTAMVLTDTDANGNVRAVGTWNTIYPDPHWDLAIHPGTIADYKPNDPNMNWLNSDTDMMIDIPLTVGNSYDFTVHKPYYEPGGFLPVIGLNLFFDGLQADNQVGISVYAACDTTGPEDGNPEMFGKDGFTVCGWPYNAATSGGGLDYRNIDKQIRVTISNYVFYDFHVYGIDSISGPNGYPLSGPDGILEDIVQFTLTVEPFASNCQDYAEYYDLDLNQDCYVNLGDFAQIAGDWLKCNDPAVPTCTDIP